MTYVVSVRFKSRGKVYFFDPNDIEVQDGDMVVVETSKGLELGECVIGNHAVEDDSIVQPLRPVIRVATADDLRVAEINKSREKEAFEICQQKIAEHGLDMKLVDVECNFEGSKILFFFTSDGRVDFRELVKDLASIFRTRIELRQIGVRDEAKMLGGLGICGRPFCCSQFLSEFQPVSTKMAKTQSRSLNPTKISGSCGRLMCCLRYEQEAYEDLVKHVPKNGAFVQTEEGYGNVVQVNLLRRKIKVKIDGDGDEVIKSYDADEVAVIPGGRPKAGEPLPSLLQPKEKEEPEDEEIEEVEEEQWEMPEIISLVKEPVAATKPSDSKTSEEGESSDGRKKLPRKRSHGKGGKGLPGAERKSQSSVEEKRCVEERRKDISGKKYGKRTQGEKHVEEGKRIAEVVERVPKKRPKRAYTLKTEGDGPSVASVLEKQKEGQTTGEHTIRFNKNRKRYRANPSENKGKTSNNPTE